MIRHLTVSAIILRDDHVLLIEHRKSSLFLPPGGHLEAGESPVGTVHREVREEVGLDVKILAEKRFSHPSITEIAAPFTIQAIDNVVDPAVGPHTHIDLVYVCRPISREVTVAEGEASGYRWVPLAEIASLRTPPELPSLVAAAAKYADSLGLQFQAKIPSGPPIAITRC